VGLNLNYPTLWFWISVAQLIINASIGIWGYLLNKNRVTNDRITKLENALAEKCSKHHDRTARLEIDINQLPSKPEICNLTNKIDRLSEKLATVDGRLGGINRAVDLLNQHHLRGSE